MEQGLTMVLSLIKPFFYYFLHMLPCFLMSATIITSFGLFMDVLPHIVGSNSWAVTITSLSVQSGMLKDTLWLPKQQ